MIGAQQAAATYSDGILRRAGVRGLSALGEGPSDGYYEPLTIGSAPVNATELANKIKNSGGSITVDPNAPEIAIAKAHGFYFSVATLVNGQTEITNTDYLSWLLYGGIAIAAVVVLKKVVL